RVGHLHCAGCARPVERDTPAGIARHVATLCAAHDPRLIVTFPVSVPATFTDDEVRGFLEHQGYTRIHRAEDPPPAAATRSGRKGAGKGAKPIAARRILHVVQDRFRLSNAETSRVDEALETALAQGN